jgi:hypothetical protein
MNSRLMIEWIERTFVPTLTARFKLLVMDSFRGHITQEVKDCFKEHGIYIAVIPGGCTPLLQPLDLTVNRSFKARLRQRWLGWISKNDNPVTRSGNVKRKETMETAAATSQMTAGQSSQSRRTRKETTEAPGSVNGMRPKRKSLVKRERERLRQKILQVQRRSTL